MTHEYIDPCSKSCNCTECYWYGRTLEERKQRNNGQDPAVYGKDGECEGYIEWNDIDSDQYTEADVERYMEQYGYEAALAKFECRVCEHGYPKCRHCEYWDGQDDIYDD